MAVQLAQPARSADMGDCNTGHGDMAIPRPGWLLTWENDSVIGPYNSDEFYTQGMQLGYRMRPDRQPDWLSDAMGKVCGLLSAHSDAGHRRLTGAGSVFFGQHFFTPGNIRDPNLIEDDRAYAAWLYVGTRLEVAQSFDAPSGLIDGLNHTFELQVGTLGPRAQGEWVQSRWHTIVPAPQPRGWDHQLPNEFGLQSRYVVRAALKKKEWRGWQLQGTVDGDFEVGTVMDTAGVGTTWRFGRNLGDPVATRLGPTFKTLSASADAQPELDPLAYVNPTTGADAGSYVSKNFERFRDIDASQACAPAIRLIECYVFANVSGHVVGYNAFLDGTMFHGGHSVDKEPFVDDFTIGARLGWRRIQLDYSVTWTSREFSPVPETAQVKSGRHGFGAINLRCQAPIGDETHGWDLVCPGLVSGLLVAIASRSAN